MRVVVDMNMSTGWIAALTAVGIDAVHWSAVGHVASSDREIIAYAREMDAIVLTRDFDFAALVAINGLSKPSIVLLRDEDRRVDPVIRRVLLVLQNFADDLAAGAIISIAATRSRVRLLPIGRTTEDS